MRGKCLHTLSNPCNESNLNADGLPLSRLCFSGSVTCHQQDKSIRPMMSNTRCDGLEKEPAAWRQQQNPPSHGPERVARDQFLRYQPLSTTVKLFLQPLSSFASNRPDSERELHKLRPVTASSVADAHWQTLCCRLVVRRAASPGRTSGSMQKQNAITAGRSAENRCPSAKWWR
jgi:hypothetical protein